MRKKVRWQLLLVLGAFFFSMMFAPSKNAQELPDPTSEFYVYDPSGTLSEETKTFIMSVNEQYELTEEKPQVVVAVVDSLEGETIEEYSVDLFEKWKIGQADADNGVLILLALEEREIRFEI
ncbi:MAG TPA: TPM domain-containing protein, partial [Trichococcus flocculiformis]|nr:TPM domain-containing protein [Trichococcus flocculiformis]